MTTLNYESMVKRTVAAISGLLTKADPLASQDCAAIRKLPVFQSSIRLALHMVPIDTAPERSIWTGDDEGLSLQTLVCAASILKQNGRIADCARLLSHLRAHHLKELLGLPPSSPLRLQCGFAEFSCGNYGVAVDLLYPSFRESEQGDSQLLKALIGLWRVRDSLDIIDNSPKIESSGAAFTVFGSILRILNRTPPNHILPPDQAPPLLRAFCRIASLESEYYTASYLSQQSPADPLDALVVAICMHRSGNVAAAEDLLARALPVIALKRSASDERWLTPEAANSLCNAAFAQRRGRIIPVYDMLRSLFAVRLMAPRLPLHRSLAAIYSVHSAEWNLLSDGAIEITVPSFLAEVTT